MSQSLQMTEGIDSVDEWNIIPFITGQDIEVSDSIEVPR